MTTQEIWNEKIANELIKTLKEHNFDAYFCKTKEEAKQKVLNLIPNGDLIAWGGSKTMEDLGVISEIKNGKYKIIDRDSETDLAKRNELMRQSLLADTFLSGTNAITLDGQLLNIDGNGNRVAALIYGPKNVIIACGINKIVKNINDAYERTRNLAAPVNAQRFDIKTPCKTNGKCANCLSQDSICNVFVTTRRSKIPNRIKIVIIGENLGF